MMSKRKPSGAGAALALVLGCAALSSAALAQAPGDRPILRGAPAAIGEAEDPMARLEAAAERLRNAMRVIRQQPPGPERERALARANEALVQTQNAMVWAQAVARDGDARALQAERAWQREAFADARRAVGEARQALRQGDTARAEQALAEVNRRLVPRAAERQQRLEQLLRAAERSLGEGDRQAAQRAVQQAQDLLRDRPPAPPRS